MLDKGNRVLYSNTIAYVVVFWLNFLLNRFWAFNSKEDFKKQIVLYGILFMFNLMVSDGMVYWLHISLKIHELIAKVLAVGLVVSWNFILYKKVIYK